MCTLHFNRHSPCLLSPSTSTHPSKPPLSTPTHPASLPSPPLLLPSRLQLVGISALRVAMSHASPRSLRSATPWPESNPQPPPLPPSATDEQAAAQQASMLELHHFTDMCADAYTGQDVEAMCAAMEAVLAPQHRTARTCKHYLRSCLHAAAREQELLPASLMAPVRYLSG